MEGAVVFAGFIADGLKNLGHPYVDFLCAHDAKGTDEDGREAIDPYMTLGMATDTSALTGMKATEYLNETED